MFNLNYYFQKNFYLLILFSIHNLFCMEPSGERLQRKRKAEELEYERPEKKPEIDLSEFQSFNKDQKFEIFNEYVLDRMTWLNDKDISKEEEKEIYKYLSFLIHYKKLDSNLKNKNGDNLLILAVRTDAIDILKVLLRNKIFDINAKNNLGHTALMEASMMGKTDIVKLLILANADINKKDYSGKTALEYAGQIHNKEIWDLLNDTAWCDQVIN